MAAQPAGDPRSSGDDAAEFPAPGVPRQPTDASEWAPLLVSDVRPTDRALVVCSYGLARPEFPLWSVVAEVRYCTRRELPGLAAASVDFVWLADVARPPWFETAEGGKATWAAVARVLRPAGRWAASGDAAVGGLARRRGTRLLRAAGLEPLRAFAAYPKTQRPNYLVPVDHWSLPSARWQEVAGRLLLPLNRAGWRATAQRWLAMRTVRHGWLRGSSPSWLLSGMRVGPGVDRQETAGSLAQSLLNECGLGAYRPALVLARRTQTVVVPAVRPSDGDLVFLKWATGPAGSRALGRHADFLARQAGRAPAPLLLPRVLVRRENLGRVCLVESSLDGLPGGRFPGPLTPLAQRAADYLLTFQQATRIEHAANGANVARWRERFQQVSGGDFWPHLRQAEQLVERFLQQVSDVRHAVLSHGDFHLGNVLFDPRTARVTGVLDWDLADETGLPAADLVQLLLSVSLRRTRTTRAAAVGALLAGTDVAGRQQLERYCQALAPELSPPGAVVLYLGMHLWRVAQQAEFLADDPQAWRRLLAETQSLLELRI